MANTAFNAKFRIVDNNSDRDNAPERNLIIDISVDEAMKMANWLQTMVDNAHIEDTKIRVYKSKSVLLFHEPEVDLQFRPPFTSHFM